MDLLHHRRPRLANALMEEYLRRTGDWEVRLLVPFYACYRAVVREKVESFSLADPGIGAARKRAAARRATSYFRLARELARRDSRPRLILVGGLPGSGKSTIASAADVGADASLSDICARSPDPEAARLRAGSTTRMTRLTYRNLPAGRTARRPQRASTQLRGRPPDARRRHWPAPWGSVRRRRVPLPGLQAARRIPELPRLQCGPSDAGGGHGRCGAFEPRPRSAGDTTKSASAAVKIAERAPFQTGQRGPFQLLATFFIASGRSGAGRVET
jgi:hypothetical protein